MIRKMSVLALALAAGLMFSTLAAEGGNRPARGKGGEGGGGEGGGQQGGQQGGPGGHRPEPGKIIKFILDHAADLSLTDEQKTKLNDLLAKGPPHPEGGGEGGAPKGDGPKRKEGPPADGAGPKGPPPGGGHGPIMDILTDEQRAKLKELLKAAHLGGGEPPRGKHPPGGGDNK